MNPITSIHLSYKNILRNKKLPYEESHLYYIMKVMALEIIQLFEVY